MYYEHIFINCDASIFTIFLDVFIVNFMQISRLDLLFPLSTLDMY